MSPIAPITSPIEISPFSESGFIGREALDTKLINDITANVDGYPIAVINRNINALRQTASGEAYRVAEAEYPDNGQEELYLGVGDYLNHLGVLLEHFQTADPAIYEQLRATPFIITIEDSPEVNYKTKETLYDLEAVHIEIVPEGVDTFSINEVNPNKPGLSDHMYVRLKQDLKPNTFHTNCDGDVKSTTDKLMELFFDHGVKSGFIVDADLTGFSLGTRDDSFYGYVIARALVNSGYRLNIAIMTSDVEADGMTNLLNDLVPSGELHPKIRALRKLDPIMNRLNIRTFLALVKGLSPAKKK
jgi:hypothetical protein